MKILKRRDFIKLSAASPLALHILFASACSTAARSVLGRDPASGGADAATTSETDTASGGGAGAVIRRSCADPLAKADLEAYARAVAIMRKITAGGQSWEAQAQIHYSHCVHNTWMFFPWHRDYLSRFEAIIRAVSGKADFALPYWDWTLNPALPLPFRDAKSPLFIEGRNDVSGLAEVCGPAIVDGLMATEDFAQFIGGQDKDGEDSSGAVEVGPHNGVHVVVGGEMGNFTSPRDPIFWLHHCNVDRLWAQWQDRYPDWKNEKRIAEVRPEYKRWLAGTLGDFYETDGSPVKANRTVRQMVTTTALGYTYAPSGMAKAALRAQAADLAAARGLASGAPTKLVRKSYSGKGLHPEIRRVNASEYIVEFPRFTNPRLLGILNDEIASPAARADWVYRLQVSGVPKFSNAIMKVYYDRPGGRAYETLIANYCFFTGMPASHGNHASGKTGVANLNFGKVLKALRGKVADKKLPFPLSFRVKFVDRNKAAVNASGGDFTSVEFRIEALQKEAVGSKSSDQD